jgi:hypothetical protein
LEKEEEEEEEEEDRNNRSVSLWKKRKIRNLRELLIATLDLIMKL